MILGAGLRYRVSAINGTKNRIYLRFAIIALERRDAMTRNIAIVLIVTAALLAIGTAQTRSQGQQGQVGRYQLLSAQYKWLATDSERKLVVDDQNQLFRIDTVTGETAVLAFRADQNSQMHSFWVAVGK
jgi:hypothetical protein